MHNQRRESLEALQVAKQRAFDFVRLGSEPDGELDKCGLNLMPQ